MKLIAHRGLFRGPDIAKENTPHQIEFALAQGFDVEIDVWYHLDSGFALGHDGPVHPVSIEWLRQDGMWLHAKNLEALDLLTRQQLNVFWHENDQFTLTSKGFIWTYPGYETTSNGVMVMPETANLDFEVLKHFNCYGVCSDYVEQIREILL